MATMTDHPRDNTGAVGLVSRLKARIPPSFAYTLLLFLASRVVLTAIGIVGYGVIAHKDVARFPDVLKIWEV